MRTIIFFLTGLQGLIPVLVPRPPLVAQEPPLKAPAELAPTRRTIIGTVIGQRKYSVLVESAGSQYDIGITPRTIIWQRIFRPEYDFPAGVVRFGLQATPNHPRARKSVEAALPQPLFIRAWFTSQEEMERCWESDAVRRLTRYELSGEPPPGLYPLHPERLQLVGLVEEIDSRGIARIDVGSARIRAQLQDREARLAGGSIPDLLPFVTVVEADLEPVPDGQWQARSILFTRWPDPLDTEDPALPRCLWLGDEASIAMHLAVREKLAGKYNLHHPPENCGGGRNAARLDAWLGPWRQPGRQWDVIVFNFGLHDLQTDDAEYARAVEDWINRLQPAARRLIWLDSVRRMPADQNVQEQLDRLNRVAESVLARHPEVQRCDPGAGFDPAAFGTIPPFEWWNHAARRIAAAVTGSDPGTDAGSSR